jgi:hypothetical protein
VTDLKTPTFGPLSGRSGGLEQLGDEKTAPGAALKTAENVLEMAENGEILFRDSNDIEPNRAEDGKPTSEADNPYIDVQEAAFIACPEDIWQPQAMTNTHETTEEIKARAPSPSSAGSIRWLSPCVALSTARTCGSRCFAGTASLRRSSRVRS